MSKQIIHIAVDNQTVSALATRHFDRADSLGFMVVVDGRGQANIIHETYDIAFCEAERLASLEPGRRVRVLAIQAEMMCDYSPHLKGVACRG